ncbi:MAG: hypothetical protein JNL98_09735 [Bryobacterales bacterium]|nr:hypothetical protein [Bryobacterales bacterium]
MSSRVLTAVRAEPVGWRKWESAMQTPAPLRSGPKLKEADEIQAIPLVEFQRKVLELEAHVKDAYQQGLAEGESKAREAFAAEIQAHTDRIAKAVADLSHLRARLRRDAEEDVVKLSIAVARRIVYRELSLDASAIEGIVTAALHRMSGIECLRVRAHSSTAAAVQGAVDRLEPVRKLEVVEDGTLLPGEFLFDTERGSLDASIEVQLKEIERGFCDRLNIRS